MNNKISKAIEKAYNYCNTHSDNDDCIWMSIYRYKALRELSEENKEEIYDILSIRLGYNKKY